MTANPLLINNFESKQEFAYWQVSYSQTGKASFTQTVAQPLAGAGAAECIFIIYDHSRSESLRCQRRLNLPRDQNYILSFGIYPFSSAPLNLELSGSNGVVIAAKLKLQPGRWQKIGIPLFDAQGPVDQITNIAFWLNSADCAEIPQTIVYLLDELRLVRPVTKADYQVPDLWYQLRDPGRFVNVVNNAGFETGTTNWNMGISGGAQIEYQIVADGYQGSALLLTNNSPKEPNVYGRLTQQVAVKPNTTYCLSMFIKATNVGEGNHLTDWGTYMFGIPGGTYDWRKFDFVFKTKPGQSSLTLGLNCVEKTEQLYLDNISLLEQTDK